MAGNLFNDFTSLKSLKKELEKNDAASSPSKLQNEPRKKTVRLKSKDEILGEEKSRELGLKPGAEEKPVFTNKVVEIDLHIEALPGVLKAAIRDELDTVYAISCSWNPYGDGATAVTIK